MEIKQKLKIKGKNVPIFIEGEEPGVVAYHTFDVSDEYDIEDAIIVDNLRRKLIDDHIEVIIEEI